MTDDAEEIVSRFYNTGGWEEDEEITEDARRWEDLREHAREYVGKCRLRVLRHVPEVGENFLDMASGPIQYREYLEYSKNYKKRYCVDLSSDALKSAKKKIGDHGVFLCGSFFDLSFEENFFDCTVSLHTIYHIDKDRQEEAVRKLVAVTKPGKPVIIVYSNPDTLVTTLVSLFPVIRWIKKFLKGSLRASNDAPESELYFHPHPLAWWSRFNDIANLQLLPWRSFNAETQQMLIPNNRLGSKLFRLLFKLEDRFPRFFVRHFQYPMIVLTKGSGHRDSGR